MRLASARSVLKDKMENTCVEASSFLPFSSDTNFAGLCFLHVRMLFGGGLWLLRCHVLLQFNWVLVF